MNVDKIIGDPCARSTEEFFFVNTFCTYNLTPGASEKKLVDITFWQGIFNEVVRFFSTFVERFSR